VGAIPLVAIADCLAVQLPLDNLVSPCIEVGDVLLVPVDDLTTSVYEGVLDSGGCLKLESVPALIFLAGLGLGPIDMSIVSPTEFGAGRSIGLVLSLILWSLSAGKSLVRWKFDPPKPTYLRDTSGVWSSATTLRTSTARCARDDRRRC
jgi:hypothetical protein